MVVNPGADGRAGADPGELAQLAVNLPDALVDHAGAVQRHEQRLCAGIRAEPPSGVVVALERVNGGRVERHEPGLAELRLADPQHPLGGVQITAVQAQRLADPHAGRREQPD